MFRFRTFRKCWLGTSSRSLFVRRNIPFGSLIRATCVQLVAIAVASLACIAISPSFYDYYESKSDLSVLIAVPTLCLTASISACVHYWSSLARSDRTFVLISIFAKRLFSSTGVPTSVAVECIWTTCFVIFNMSRSSPLACLYGSAGLYWEYADLLQVLSLYSLGVEGDVKKASAHMPFLLVEICCWSLTGLSKF
jgi:hypothetical protein